ncbi:MAG: hypothetical protein V1874_08225 [Spirochaetota bacterium]
MNAYKLLTNIPKERKIYLEIPSSFPVGPVEIIMLSGDKAESVNEENIKKIYGSFKGSKFNSERFIQLKQEEKELDR